MINYLLKKIFGTSNERELKKLAPIIEKINKLEPEISSFSDEQLKGYSDKFRERLNSGETLEDILPDVFAIVREAGKRALNMRHFDVQLLGGIILHRGMIAEMKTGEGKTLVATLAAYLNALEGKGVHIVTVNDYLASRDSEWMGKIYTFLGLTVGVIKHGMNDEERKAAYNCDITYGTNNEFGFDYLRDNMKFEVENLCQKEFNFAIIDEVDSILIDEARTPLIISGPTEESTSLYYNVNNFIKRIKSDQTTFELDLKSKTVTLTEQGINAAEEFFKLSNLYDLTNMDTLHQINQSLRAHLLFTRDVDYLVSDNQVVIVDEFTGRMMPGRRFSDGLHQALEAKENVKIEQEYQTHATITFQNLFRMYGKLSGMTGTAITEAVEFHSIYKLDVMELPTNKPLIREEMADVIYGSTEEKWDAVVKEIRALNEKGQPVLVGTISIENSEILHRRLTREHIKHHVLNAKYHESEAEIVAQAGRKGSVTIATNMAGRGTDIVLGGNPDFLLREELKKRGFTPTNAPETILTKAEDEVKRHHIIEQNEVLAVGGLHILGTERHESRRIDNQLRGRSGRQGDPGSSRFYISLEDDLMRILGGDRVKGLLVRAGMSEGNPIENKFVTKAIENAQKQIEGQNFSMRKHLLEYDDVMNKQRQYIYSVRKDILFGKDFKDHVAELILDIYESIIKYHLDENKDPEEWNIESFEKEIAAQYAINTNDALDEKISELPYYEIRDTILAAINDSYNSKEELIGSENLREFERWIMLQIIDTQWKDHLLNIDHLKEGIGLRGYAQKDPLIEYKKESFGLFQELQDRIDDEVIRTLFFFKPVAEDEIENLRQKKTSKLTRPSSKMPGRKSGKKKKKKKRR